MKYKTKNNVIMGFFITSINDFLIKFINIFPLESKNIKIQSIIKYSISKEKNKVKNVKIFKKTQLSWDFDLR